MERGTIVLTVFPFTDLSSTKRRPALILSPKESIQGDYIVAFISSVVPNFLLETDFLISNPKENYFESGLEKDSIIKTDKLVTLNKSVFTGIIGNFTLENMEIVDKKLKIALGLK
jgi:mRNA interferase MazF